jgi:hypothetical protein
MSPRRTLMLGGVLILPGVLLYGALVVLVSIKEYVMEDLTDDD